MTNDELMAEIARSNALRAGGDGMYYRDEGGTFRLDLEANVPPLPPEETSIWDDIGSAFGEVGSQLHEFGKGIGVGWEKGQTNILKDIPFFEGLTFSDGRPVENLSHLGEWADEQLGTQIEVGKPEGVAGMIGEGLGQFLPGYIPATKFLRMTGLFNRNNLLGRVARETVAGAIGDFGTSSDEEAEALLGMLSMIPEEYGGGVAKDLSQTLTDWMEGEDGDTDELRGRLVASIPGAVLTGPLEGLMSLAGVVWRSGKKSRQAFARGVKNWWENPQPMQGMYTGIPFPMGHNRPPADMRLEVETPEPPRTDISPEGTYSAARRAAENLPDKGSPQEMLALLKNPEKVGETVRDDELKWTGLIESRAGVASGLAHGLLDDPDRKSITRDEILAHLDSHEVQITSRDLGEEAAASEPMVWGDPEPDMDDVYIASRVDEEMSEIGRTFQDELDYPWVGVRPALEQRGWRTEELDGIEAHLLEQGELPEDVKLQNDVYDILTEQQEQSYREDPYWQTWRTDEGYQIHGGEMGYTVTDPEGGGVTGINTTVGDLDEAMRLADEDRTGVIGGEAQDLYESETLRMGSFEDYKVMTINLADEKQSPIITSSADFGKFDAGHFRDEHQLMHVRFNTRKFDGEDYVFIEEFQSDPGRGSALRAQRGGAATDLPFIGDTKKYVGLAIRRMLTYAAKNDFAGIAWTTGKQQAERYNLAKYIDRIELSPGGNLRAYDKHGNEQIVQTGVDDARLDELLGKEVADRLRAVEPNPPLDNAGIARLQDLNRKAGDMERNLTPEEYAEYLDLKTRFTTPPGKVLENVDLETGGEFHKRLYDKTVANELRAAIKTLKLGKGKAKITQGNVEQFGTTLGAQGPRILRDRAERLRAISTEEEDFVRVANEEIAAALDMIADAGPDANLDELLSKLDPGGARGLRGMVEANIPEYTSPAKRAEGIVHTFAIDAATRDKILKKGLPLFPAIAAAVVGAESGESLAGERPGLEITADQPMSIGEGSFDPENLPPGYVLKDGKAVRAPRSRTRRPAKRRNNGAS